MRYSKALNLPSKKTQQNKDADLAVLGMLYLVEVNLLHKITGEKIKHKLLLVGCEASDIERKMKWYFDAHKYSITVKSVEKVREKIHFLNTTITHTDEYVGPTIETLDGSRTIPQGKTTIDGSERRLYAVGIATTMIGYDQDHVLRKVGHALIGSVTEGKSHSGAKLSDNSTITVEEIAFSSGFAMPRDTMSEVNRARIVGG